MKAADKLAAALWEADCHKEALTEALAEWDLARATASEELEADRAHIRVVDQLLFRFINLQYAAGERLIPATLASLREPL